MATGKAALEDGSPKGNRAPVSAVREIIHSLMVLLKTPFMLMTSRLADFCHNEFWHLSTLFRKIFSKNGPHGGPHEIAAGRCSPSLSDRKIGVL